MRVCVFTADVLGAAPKHPAMPFMSQVTREPIGRARGIGSAAPRSALVAAAPSTAAAPPASVAAAAAPTEVVESPLPPAPAPRAAAETRMEPGATILQLSGQPPSAPSAESASSIAAASVKDTAAVRPLYTKLRELDREQCGLLTPAELSTALAQCDVEVTPSSVDALATKYDTARTCVQLPTLSNPLVFFFFAWCCCHPRCFARCSPTFAPVSVGGGGERKYRRRWTDELLCCMSETLRCQLR